MAWSQSALVSIPGHEVLPSTVQLPDRAPVSFDFFCSMGTILLEVGSCSGTTGAVLALHLCFCFPLMLLIARDGHLVM